MKRLAIGLAVAAVLLGGCGARESLKPAPDAALPPQPYGATTTPTPDDLLTAPTQARPGRSDNLLESADKRRSDEFDLPPPN